jgi:feruloyl esterase
MNTVMSRSKARLLSFMLVTGFGSGQAAGAATCESLSSVAIPHTTITKAEVVPAGAFPAPPGRGGGEGARARFDNLAAFCRVSATSKPSSDSDIKIEVWLPAANWNGKLRGTGNGGLGGGAGVGVGALASGIRAGYVTVGSNTGHEGDASYALTHPEKIIDFGYRSAHEMTVTAKAVIAAFYGSGPKFSYMAECGGGSIAALSEAQRYPADYDAIAAGGFGADLTHHTAGQMWIWQATHQTAASYIPPAKYPAIHEAALAKCDALDGVKDGVISDPAHCNFDPGAIQCGNVDGPNCLTGSQVEAARKIYAGPKNPRTGKQVFSPLYPGSELGWEQLAGPQPLGIATDFFKYFAFKDPRWDYYTRRINFDSDIELANKPENLPVDAMDPDLKKFTGRGGKLLLYNGWNDTSIPPGVAVDYYKSVVGKTGGKTVQSDVRFFMVPGMGHCPGTNGADSYNFDSLGLIEQWKENGKAPGQLVATHLNEGKQVGTRLVCRYPQVATYKGTGSTSDAGNFMCKGSNSR